MEVRRRPFQAGDMVRVVVRTKGETAEHHYGRITQSRKANGGLYRGPPVKPHFDYVELEHCHRSGWLGPFMKS